MKPERDRYQAALESLADGVQVDWAALDSAAVTSAERRRYRNLRLVARVAELHRTLTLDEQARVPPPARQFDVSPEAPTTWGHLQIRERLASGAYGEVYVARDPQLNIDVALKLLRRPSAGAPLDQLLAEARTLAKVRHANVVRVYGADVREGRAGLWMDLVQGQTLESWLQAHGTLGAGEAAAAGGDVCRALAAVHAAGLVHGDVKAQNVMREQGGRVVLMDFGAGRAQGGDAAGVAGTPLYLAPEVLAGEPPTPRSDIYSVGVLLFHLLTGRYPYSAGDLAGLRAAHAGGARAWLRDLRADLPGPMVDTIERALDPDPARRFASAGEMERALGRWPKDDLEDAARPRRVIGFAAAAAALLALVATLVVSSRLREDRRGLLPSAIRSIAVVPVSDLTPSTLPVHFADGLTDELVATLGQLPSLTVKPAASPQEQQRSRKDLARTLDVDAVLETTLTGVGDEGHPGLKMRARLLAAGTQSIVWSQEFERPRGATLELPGAVAAAIARALQLEMTAAASSRLNARQQINPTVEEAYLQGRAYLDQYGGGSARQALDAFQRALQLEPKHAGALSGAARAYMVLGVSGIIPNTQARAAAVNEARRAIDADRDLAEPHATLGYLSFLYDWDWLEADREFSRSLELNPNSVYARTYYAEFLASQRRFDEAIAQAEAAKRLEPESIVAARGHAVVLYYKRDFDGAQRALEEARAIEPGNAAISVLASRVAEAKGNLREALDATTHAIEISNGGNVPLRVQEIRQQALLGHTDDALRGLRSLRNEADLGTIRLTSRDLGYIYLAFGNRTDSVQEFARAAAEREPTIVWLGVDPRVDALQHDPGFRRVLAAIGLQPAP